MNMDQKFQDYQHQPLSSARHIRLLRITSSVEVGSSAYYDIITVSLEEKPSYYALSYTWGNPIFDDEDERDNRLDNKSKLLLRNGKTLEIGQNLSNALHHFSEIGMFEDFWIDAICIDQSNLHERNAQVSIMGDIYASAEKVIIWLGKEDWNSQVAMVFIEEFMPKIGELQKREGKNQDFSYSFSELRLYDRLGEPEIPEEMFDGLASFLERSWFRRAWTYQEILLAQDFDIYCGSTRISWPQLESLLKFLEHSEWDLHLSRFQASRKVQQVPGIMILSTMWLRGQLANDGPRERRYRIYLEKIASGGSSMDLLMAYLDHLLYGMRCRKATDAKDHVYALFGITSRISESMQISNPLPSPDYQADVDTTQAYTKYCKAILAVSNSLLLLSNVEDRADNNHPLPSWVPDFSKNWTVGLPRSGPGTFYDASRGLMPQVLPSSVLAKLSLSAYYFDDIAALGENDFELGRGEIPFTKSAEIILNTPPQYRTGQDRAEVLWRTLIADQAQSQCPAPAQMGDAFFEHMLMHNSMSILNEETNHSEADLDILKPLSTLAASTSMSAKCIPSLSQILERKQAYAKVKAMKQAASAGKLNEDEMLYLKESIKSLLAAESRARPFARQLGHIFISKRLVTTTRDFVGLAPLST